MTAQTRLLVIGLLAVAGIGGWFSARSVSGSDAVLRTAVGRATVIRTVRVRRTQYLRGARTPDRTTTVVLRKRVVRIVPRARTLTAVVSTPQAGKTVTDVRRRTVVEKKTETVTNVQTQPAQTVTRTVTTPPGHADPPGHETRTVTVTVTVPTGTVTVTVPKGHSKD
jgi:hypothetical protein